MAERSNETNDKEQDVEHCHQLDATYGPPATSRKRGVLLLALVYQTLYMTCGLARASNASSFGSGAYPVLEARTRGVAPRKSYCVGATHAALQVVGSCIMFGSTEVGLVAFAGRGTLWDFRNRSFDTRRLLVVFLIRIS
jgi:hypothetical protein